MLSELTEGLAVAGPEDRQSTAKDDKPGPILPHEGVQPYTLFLAKGRGSASYPSIMAVARGEDSENETFDGIFVKNRRFWRAAPQVNEDFLCAFKTHILAKHGSRASAPPCTRQFGSAIQEWIGTAVNGFSRSV